MMPGPTQFIECPNCGTGVISETLSSGNTFGAQFWSDGYMDAPMLPEYPRVVKCAGCKEYFWLDDGRVAEEFYLMEPEIELKIKEGKVRWAKHLTAAQIGQFLKQKEHQPDKEVYLRLRLWWKLNHPLRKNLVTNLTPKNKESFLKNLVRLRSIFPVIEPHDNLIRVEILRELGKYREAIEIAHSVMDEYHHPLQQIVERCARKEKDVFEIDWERPENMIECNVIGLRFHDYPDKESQKELVHETELVLRREKENVHDKDAVAVLTKTGKMVGYIPRGENHAVAMRMDAGEKLRAVVVRVNVGKEEWERVRIAIIPIEN